MEGEAVKGKRIEKLVLALGSLPANCQPSEARKQNFGGNRA